MAPITRTSPAGDNFIVDKEAYVTRAYKDVGGVVTIGPGLTMLSRVFADYWRATHGGRALREGDVLPRPEGMRVFRRVLEEEYCPPVVRNIAPKEQHHMDGATSVAYNAGPASTKWKWAQALRDGLVKQSAALLRTTAITAGGRPINGLRIRRAAEARLIEHADYGRAVSNTEAGGRTPTGIASTPAEIREYQNQLRRLGYYKGAVDGVVGDLTRGAVRNFQRAAGLKVDGIVGPATRAALARALATKGQGEVMAGGGIGIPGGTGFGFQIDNPVTLLLIAGGVILLLLIAFTVWNNRGRILGKRTPA